jgi:ABC-type multidrug transport system fused ATPase/permease subunit
VLADVRKIRRLLSPQERRAAFLLVALMIAGSGLETLCAGLVIPAIAILMQHDLRATYPGVQPFLASLGDPGAATLIVIVVLGLTAIYLVKNLFLGYVAWRQMKLAFGVHSRLSQQLFALYLRQPYTFHLQRNSAYLVRNVTGEVAQVADAIMHGLILLSEALVLAGISALLLIVEPVGALISVAVLGAAAGLFYGGTRGRVSAWAEARLFHDRLRHFHLYQGLGGVKEVKLLGRERGFLDLYRMHTTQSLRVAQLQATLPPLSRLWLEVLAVAGLAVLAITMLAQGRPVATIVPTLGLFAVAAFRLLPAVDRVVHAVQLLRSREPGIRSLYEEFRLTAEEPVPARTGRAPFRAAIHLAGVSYTYAGRSTPALSGINLSIGKGESVGFIGPSGSGKSTLVDLILGLLTPQTGRITVDGEDIRDDLRGWQDQIGYVPQALYLTDDSLRRNVAFGIPEAQIDNERVRRAVRGSQLEEFVDTLPDGIDTVVGERGVRLSGGQRQRIAIARALYHDPAVLVLDEATSALDTATEEGVIRAVAALKGQVTVVVVAHRLSSMAACDRIYRLEHGRIAQEATAGPRAASAHD